MKFLCVSCDEPMKLSEKSGPDRGSVALVFACQECGQKTAMLTNPFETQLVTSLGVQIGPNGEKVQGESKCPFTGMIADMEAEKKKGFPWTDRARQRLANMPEFVRPMAQTSIEKFAKDHGYESVDESVLSQARAFFGV